MASLSSQNLSESDRTSFFATVSAGSNIGAVLTGTLGSFLLEYFGWSHVFYVIGKFRLLAVKKLFISLLFNFLFFSINF